MKLQVIAKSGTPATRPAPRAATARIPDREPGLSSTGPTPASGPGHRWAGHPVPETFPVRPVAGEAFVNEYTGEEETRFVDQVVVEHGTLPAAELFHELAPLARNEGELDLEALIAGRPQAVASNPDGEFMLFRVGDAVASRNIHAAIYDSLRLCKEL